MSKDVNYKLLVVDDEAAIREGLAQFIECECNGFTVVGVMGDGRQVIEWLRNNHADVIMTDIRMTHASGLDLAKYIYENKLPIKVILISGYKEFEYARQAIIYNVEHYLLKPTKLGEIKDTFERVRAQLDKERSEAEKLHHIEKDYNELLPIIREQFFSDMVMGILDNKDEIKNRLRLSRFNFDAEACPCWHINVCVKNDNIQNSFGTEKKLAMVKNYLNFEKDGIKYYAVSNFNDNINVVAIITKPANHSVPYDTIIKNHLTNVSNSIYQLFDIDIIIHLNRSFRNLYDMCFYFTPAYIRNYADEYIKSEFIEIEILGKSSKEWQERFVSYMSSGNMEALENSLMNFVDAFEISEIRYLHNFIIDLFATLCIRLRKLGIPINFGDHVFDYHELVNLYEKKKIKTWCKKALEYIRKCTDLYRESSSDQIIEKAKLFIGENYNKDITLEDVAKEVFLSPVHFSRLFKRKTGENYIDYLVRVRMEKAADLLKQYKYKVYEISSMVGYSNNKYFTKVFKEYSGYTPSEYRNNMLRRMDSEIEE